MTVDSTHEPLPCGRSRRRDLNPMLTIRAVQIVLWMLVLSGPVAVLVVATRMSSVGDRLDALHTAAVVEVPPDTSGVEGFAELFIAPISVPAKIRLQRARNVPVSCRQSR